MIIEFGCLILNSAHQETTPGKSDLAPLDSTLGGGKGIMLTGHHELMFPLLTAAIREELAKPSRKPHPS